MEISTVILLSIGLAADALAVSVTHAASSLRFRWSETLKIAGLFGLFQAAMPLVGWLVGLTFKDYIISIDHWVAFTILSLIGLRMIYHDFRSNEGEEEVDLLEKDGAGNLWTLLALAVATSIDALVVGIGFIVLPSIVFPIASIGLVTFALCTLGAYFGHRYKHLAGKKVNTVGGAILIFIGIKILIEHLQH